MEPLSERTTIGMLDEIRALVIGHAVGDAIGVPVETVTREPLAEARARMRTHPVVVMEPSEHWQLPVGCWSDDTSMVLAEMRSMSERGRFDPKDIMRNFVRWLKGNEFTPTGRAFGTGRTCTMAIERFEKWQAARVQAVGAGADAGVGAEADAEVSAGADTAVDAGAELPAVTWDSAAEWGLAGEKHNGNGSLMRIMPVAIVCHRFDLDTKAQYELVRGMSGLTHRHPQSVMACSIHVNMLRHLMEGEDLPWAYFRTKEDDYSMFAPETYDVYRNLLGITSSIREQNRDSVPSTGYVRDTLMAAYWVLLTTYSFREAVLRALDLGGDTDTIAALVGEMAALHYGLEAIPPEWLEQLQRLEDLEESCVQLAETEFKI